MTYEEIVQFHGHECPGLALGYKMATAAMGKLAALRCQDEELVAIVENDACGVDALQCVTGCTLGKGNLFFRDYGKQVYTVCSRATGKGVRVHFHGRGIPEHLRENRDQVAKWILSAENDSILSAASVSIPVPERARIMDSLPCGICGEGVMESRIRRLADKTVCIPCHERQREPEQTTAENTVGRAAKLYVAREMTGHRIQPVGTIHSPYTTKESCPIQGAVKPEGKGRVDIFPEYSDGLKDIETFSHIILLYLFDRSGDVRLIRPTFLEDTPHGIFASRHPCRPNSIGVSIVKLDGRNGNKLHVSRIDVLDGTPLIDVKPYVPRFDHVESAGNGWTGGKKLRPKSRGIE